MAIKSKGAGRNDNRPNGKASKKNPGPAQPPKTNFEHINGRSPSNNAKREAWKAAGGRWNHKSIPHWKTGGMMTKLICKMYNHNKWWSVWWKIPVIDRMFYKLHDLVCKDN